jgi:hypothetical protein
VSGKAGDRALMDVSRSRKCCTINKKLAERVGFEPVHKPQTKGLTEHGQQI